MSELICNTSPLQYLHQLGRLEVLRSLAGGVTVPSAVMKELERGRINGVDLPEVRRLGWFRIQDPISRPVLPLMRALDPGEASVLALALERKTAIAVLDDRLARRVALRLNVRLTGTLGILVDAKKAGLIPAVAPLLQQLHQLRFRVSAATHLMILPAAGESE
ncbi:MAG: DUF3368 domain-containing protein [Verrucomicrobia bacterium]|nr:DUF3368 domain-containing protein [Verrucomicrobiota bacterium]